MNQKKATSSGNRVINAVFWSMVSGWSTHLFDFVVTLFLARLLAPADFGLVALVTVYVALGNVFVRGGFSQAIIQREEIDDLHLDTAFWTNVAIGVTLTVVTMIFGPSAFEYLFDEGRLENIIKVASVLFTIAALQGVQQALLTRKLAFKQLAIRRAGGSFVGGIVAVVLAIRGFGVWSLVALHVTSSLVSLILLWIVGRWRPRLRFSMLRFHQLFSFGMHVVGKQLLEFANSRGINFFIGLFLGTTALGYFVLANRIVRSLVGLITDSIQSVAFPVFSRLQNNRSRLVDALYKAVRFTGVVSVPTFLGLASVAALVVSLLLGPKWASSVPVLQLLCVNGLLNSVSRYMNIAMLACGKSNWLLYTRVIQVIVGYTAFFIVVDSGIVAVAAARVATEYLMAPVTFVAVHWLIKYSYRSYFRLLAPALIGSLAMVSVVYLVITLNFVSTGPALQLAAVVTIGAAVYIASIYLMDRSIFKEVRAMAVELWPALDNKNPRK